MIATSGKPNMYVLGIHDGHNATACLLKDGVVAACASEERFSRIKNQAGYPAMSAAWCLEQEGISGADLDRVALAGFRVADLDNLACLSKTASRRERLLFRASRIERSLPPKWGAALYRSYVATVGHLQLRERISLISKSLGVAGQKIDVVEHHSAHAYAAYFGSPYRGGTLVLTLDGEGDGLCGSVSIAQDGVLRRIVSVPYYSSIGLIYLAATQFLGMKPNEHEYKVMGLAPYAHESDMQKVYDRMARLSRITGQNQFDSCINARYAYDWFRDNCVGYRFDWIAGAVQKLCEEVLLSWVDNLAQEYGIKALALGGGVFMNVKANMMISQLPCVEQIFFMPSCGDESLAMGAAFFSYATKCGDANDIVPLSSLYLGPEYKADSSTLDELLDGKATLEHSSNIEDTIAGLLVQGNIVARCSGRMEWGARALGNRSILARADNVEVVDTLNTMIKQRDFWMPFAPTLLSEREEDYLSNPKRIPAPYMIIAFQSTGSAQKDLRAAMHPADKTLRPQILLEPHNPAYYRILKQVEERTGLGGILNTSFNLHGEPIVCTPADAVSTFLRSGLRYLAIDDFLIKKT